MAIPIISAGGIVYHRAAGEAQILMIADSQQRWSFPKGMVHRDEEPEAAALREVAEETGVRGEIVRELGATNYIYRQGSRLINKTVHFYLIRALSTAITPQLSEVAAAQWFPAAEALRRSTFAANTDLLRQAVAILAAGEEKRINLT